MNFVKKICCMPSVVGSMTGIFNIVSLEIVLITKKKKKAWREAFVAASNMSVSTVHSMDLGFAVVWLWFFSLQLLILNTLISLVVVTVLVDCYSNFRKCL